MSVSKMGSKGQHRRKVFVTARPHLLLFGSAYILRSCKQETCVCRCYLQFYLLMDEMFSWNRQLQHAVSPRRGGLRNKSLIKTRSLQNVETSMSSANIQKHSNVEPCSSHRRRLLVSGAGWSQSWTLVPSTVQKKKCQLCVTKSFFSLCCPAVPPVSNAGKVYGRYCPRDGVPQREELHPQRPRRSQLHVSTISASTFTLSVPVCVITLLLNRTKSRPRDCQSNIWERESPKKAEYDAERHATFAWACN